MFSDMAEFGAVPAPVDLKALHAKIGELALKNDFLRALTACLLERKAMTDRTHVLPISRRCWF